MDFIERLFGVSPDAGSGTTELAIALIPVLIFGLIAFYRSPRRT
jgi:hypothetical protein